MKRGWIVGAALWASAGCGGSGAELEAETDGRLEPISLLDPWFLVPIEAGADPLAHHRPSEVDCPPSAWGTEGGSFEVETGVCNYAAFGQPLPTELGFGDELHIVIWHDLLDAPEPAVAHAAVWVGTSVLWETEVPIPAPSSALEAVVPVRAPVPAGALLGLHLHNHGFNSWRFVSIDVHRAFGGAFVTD